MGDERGDDADQRRADVYSSARIGAAAALTIVLVLLVLDVAVPDYDISPGIRANAILRPPIVTVTVKAGDTPSEIAAAHGLALTSTAPTRGSCTRATSSV